MKKTKLATLVLLAGLWSFSGCTQQETATEATTEHAHDHDHAATEKAYICPMKCEGSASDAPGQCPVCGMDLKENPNYVAPPVSPSADPTQSGTIASDTSLTN
ncbi:MAG TPA: heavy metal-binding domain-containing protein [Adhaeribacter sp.]|nr:heavy metal-binding domain-containing protein [Adhaeribacter sp.]